MVITEASPFPSPENFILPFMALALLLFKVIVA